MPTRYHVGTQSPATADAAGIMAALAALFAVTQDVDIPGADGVVSALTWTRDTTAGSQAIYSSAFGPRNSRILIAVHDSGTPSPSPTMIASADSYAAAHIMIGLCDNAAGNYIAWQNAGPFYQSGGSGSVCTFAGFYRLAPTSAMAAGGHIRGIVSTKDLLLQCTTSAATVYTVHIGARLTGVSSPSGLAESDGYRYGMMTSGYSGDHASVWRSSTSSSAGYWGKDSTSGGNPHSGCYAVGGTSWQTDGVECVRVRSCTADSGLLVSGGSPTGARVGISFGRATSPYNTIGSWAGVGDWKASRTGNPVQSTTATVGGWAVASSSTADEDSVVFLRSF